MSENVLVTNIQRFSLHDGPGIRTTVFLKGCSLRCPWCANPENLRMCPEPYIKDGVSGEYGRYVNCEELYGELVKDRMFYVEGGGVTFSGGEALLQIDRLEPLLIRLKEERIHMCVETALFVSEEQMALALKYIDMFYVDIKLLDAAACRRVLHGDLKCYERNLRSLFSSDIPVVFRIPIIGGYTDGIENLDRVERLLKQFRPLKVELLKEHNLGAKKYETLGMVPPSLTGVTEEKLEQFRERICQLGIPAEICRI